MLMMPVGYYYMRMKMMVHLCIGLCTWRGLKTQKGVKGKTVTCLSVRSVYIYCTVLHCNVCLSF